MNQNQMKQQAFQNAMDRSQLLANAYMGRGLQKDQDKAAREATIMSLGQGIGRTAGGAADTYFGGGLGGFF